MKNRGGDKQESQRARAEAQRKKEEEKRKALEEARKREAKSAEALKRSNAPKVVPLQFAEIIEKCPRLEDILGEKKVPHVYHQLNPDPIITAFSKLLSIGNRVREIQDWKPQGKSDSALFKSLAAHLLAKYPMPQFLWSAFFHPEITERDRLVKMVAYIAGGGSIKKLLKERPDIAPYHMTTAMIHEFMKGTGNLTVIEAIRAAQARCVGGSHRFQNVVASSFLGRGTWNRDTEEWNVTMMQWLAQQPMLDPERIIPMMDFLNNERATKPGYSLKGRTAVSVIRGMEEWHNELARTRPDKGYKGKLTYVPSGFKEAEFDLSREVNGVMHAEIWRFKEILTAKDLFDEGKRQGHCVSSYAGSIESGRISIWVLTMEDNTGNWAKLTLEIINSTGQIVQARGRYNRLPTPVENQMLNRWMSVYR